MLSTLDVDDWMPTCFYENLMKRVERTEIF